MITKHKKKSSKAQDKADLATQAFISNKSLKTDPLGSYTGRPLNSKDIPTQDADDL